MNKRQAKNRILDLVNDKGSISAPGRFPAHIFNELNVGNGASAQIKNNIMGAVEDLAAAGKIEVERRGEVILGIAPVRNRRITNPGPEARRQRLHATDAVGNQLPSFLPDSMCSPVTIRKIGEPAPVAAEQKESAVTQVSEPVAPSITYHKKEMFHETLTRSLQVLRMEANEEGLGVGLSVKLVLQCAGLTESQSDRVLEFLRVLDLYSTKMTGFQKSDYSVALQPEVITAEMVVEARSKLRPPVDKQVGADTNPDENILDRMADIIEKLEQDLAASQNKARALKGQLQRSDAKVRTRDKRIEKAEAKHAADKRRIEELEAEVATLKQRPAVVPSSRIDSVLSRYGS